MSDLVKVFAYASPTDRGGALGELLGLGAPPLGDFLVIAGQQHLGDGAALQLARPRVMRIFEQAAAKLSSASEPSLPATPGSSRTQASISTCAASSPPDST